METERLKRRYVYASVVKEVERFAAENYLHIEEYVPRGKDNFPYWLFRYIEHLKVKRK